MSLVESDYDNPLELLNSFEKTTWEHIAEAKRLFLEKGVDPTLSPDVRPEIAASWIRSKAHNISPDKKHLSIELDSNQYQQILHEHERLIDVSQPLLSITKNLALGDEYVFELIGVDGITLSQTGNLNLHKYVSNNSIFNESTMGTNAHSLSTQHKVPFMVLGPEHYCNALTNLAAIAAPIMGLDNTVVATLLLTQPLPSLPWSKEYQRLLSHTVGLIASIAFAIEYQLQYRSTYMLLADTEHKMDDALLASSQAYQLLKTTVETSNEGIIVVDDGGTIKYMSPEAGHLLGTPIDIANGKPIFDFLGLAWPDDFLPYINTRNGKSFTKGSQTYILRGSYVLDAKTGDNEGAVLKLQAVKHALTDSKQQRVGDVAAIGFDGILGTSIAISAAIKSAQRFANAPENILLTGETGTGKEYFAQALHNASRPTGPFMSINCAAIPPRLIESELFGYESGSFTGADRSGKPGKFELAHGGTIFLDEISDMELELQATLLRVLENKRVMRLGGSRYKQVDFRVIAATNRDLAQMVKDNTFREDLYYRLTVLTIKLPPLRERASDTVLLAKYYLNECHCKASGGPHDFAPAALDLIAKYTWPGNVRQLKNAIFSAYYSARGASILPSDLPEYVSNSNEESATESAADCIADYITPVAQHTKSSEPSSLQQTEEDAIRGALQALNNNVTAAATLLKISRATLYRKIKAYDIKMSD